MIRFYEVCMCKNTRGIDVLCMLFLVESKCCCKSIYFKYTFEIHPAFVS